MPDQSESLLRVKAALADAGSNCEVVELPSSTHTAAEAAAAIGCHVDQIAKSIVFRGAQTGRAVIVIASGGSRVDERRVQAEVGEPVAKASAEFVRGRTGFVIGGVAPVGHTGPVTLLLDGDLWRHAEIWAAAGTSHTVFRTTASDLQRITGATKY